MPRWLVEFSASLGAAVVERTTRCSGAAAGGGLLSLSVVFLAARTYLEGAAASAVIPRRELEGETVVLRGRAGSRRCLLCGCSLVLFVRRWVKTAQGKNRGIGPTDAASALAKKRRGNRSQVGIERRAITGGKQKLGDARHGDSPRAGVGGSRLWIAPPTPAAIFALRRRLDLLPPA